MRTILRVGITVGGVAFVVLFALQSAIGLAVTTGIILAGLSAGLGAAKWLERPWFGRQFTAGLRVGAIAVGMAGVSVLLASLTRGPRSVEQLAARSHVFILDLGPLIRHLAGAGWVGVDIVVIAMAMLIGTGLSMLITQFGAWSKSRHAIQVVNQARRAAQVSLRGDSWVGTAGAPDILGSASMSPSAYGTGVGAYQANPSSASSLGNHTLIPTESERFQQADSTRHAAPHQSSKARPADSQLTEAMREALATWAADNAMTNETDSSGSTQGQFGPKARTPQPSNYLNSTPPAPPKRARKKQNTDWLC